MANSPQLTKSDNIAQRISTTQGRGAKQINRSAKRELAKINYRMTGDYVMGCIHLITYGPFDQFPIKKIQHIALIKKSMFSHITRK